jgi:predicted membrane-bound mannosyltransferase
LFRHAFDIVVLYATISVIIAVAAAAERRRHFDATPRPLIAFTPPLMITPATPRR